ncbi:2-dehydro-3-deoxygalactonokinase [Neolewinella sp.]|uniref:2-dehydro-3-deoxygalactonokinase n=1 Tax=Neolewinella sp. TaxID=2993543 RepID=UPI003B51B0B0
MAPTSTYFISCDWGTSNLRLRVVARPSLTVVARHRSDLGIKLVHDRFRASGVVSRSEYFLSQLRQQLNGLPAEHRHHTVIVSGMASSSIGLKELPYAELPLEGEGGGLITEWLSFDAIQRLLLVSGVRTTDDIMRGEETQAIGALPHFAGGSGTLLLPGTHSKHLSVHRGKIAVFTTYLTGELFELLTTHSILAASVEHADLEASGTHRAAFREGLRKSAGGTLSSKLFGVRVREVLNSAAATDNYYYLSGLLIGDEIRGLTQSRDSVHLVAEGVLLELYRMALTYYLPTASLTFHHQEILLIGGQYKLLQRHERPA